MDRPSVPPGARAIMGNINSAGVGASPATLALYAVDSATPEALNRSAVAHGVIAGGFIETQYNPRIHNTFGVGTLLPGA